MLLEKPMAIVAGQAEELEALAERKGRVLAVALNPPYWPHTRHARALIEEGKIGRVEAAAIDWVGNAEAVFGRAPLPEKMPGVVKPTLYRADHVASGGGHLIDTGSHLVSELLMLTGLPALSVSAAMDDASIDMRASLLVSLQGGVPATITAIADSRHPERRIHNVYFGSEGTLEISGMPFGVRLFRPGDETRMWSEKDLPPAPGPVDDFVDAVAGGRAPASTAAHGAAVTRVVEAAYRSARTGGRIPAGRD